MKHAGNKTVSRECQAFFKKISQYLDSELDPKASREVGRHIKECFRCQNCLAMLQRTLDICRSLTPLEVPRHVRKGLDRIVKP
jgi:anti-sigma factor RsiW